ncbi:MAG: sn-glycerol-1-phosphate dehydrogenase [Clostridia bacterium]|nr:sn-glycerol-1-phosphate dehydrogenase [Clostridia bacterium]
MKLDIGKYIDKKIECSCGHTHYCPISNVVVEKNAIEKLGGLMAPYKKIVLVADENTWAACGERVEKILADKVCAKLIYVREGLLVPDEHAVAELNDVMPADCDFVVGVGSGVINDICKYVTFEKKMDYAIVGTAPSMDGYASSGAAMIMYGMKITYTTHPPKMIIADIDVLKNAPMDMIRAGYGDIIGKYSALNDWKLSKLINNEYFCQEIYDLVMDVTNNIRDMVSGIVAREEGAIEYLTKALVLIGVTLSLLGSTRPGSGSEHHLSHFFEIVGLIHNKPYFLHGTDVAYSTVVTAAMREEIVKLGKPVFNTAAREQRLAAYDRIFASFAGEVRKIQDEAGSYERDLNPVYIEKWDEIIRILAECPTAREITDMFIAAGFDMDAFENMYGKEEIRDASFYGKDLKDRYSVLWLYFALFGGQAG